MQFRLILNGPTTTADTPALVDALATVMALMESWYPAATAQSWDRVGLIVGDPAAPVRSILLALDPTAAIADQAVAGPSGDGQPYDMVITHHPLLLRGASFLPVTDPKGGVVTTLIRSGVALFNAHTNADVACDGVATALADLIGLRDTVAAGAVWHRRRGTRDRPGARRHRRRDDARCLRRPRRIRAARRPHRSLRRRGREARRCPGSPSWAAQGIARLTRLAPPELTCTSRPTCVITPPPSTSRADAPRCCAVPTGRRSPRGSPSSHVRSGQAARSADVELRVEVSTIVTEPWTSHRVTQGELA